MHHASRRGSHASFNDQHLHPTQHRSRRQSPQHLLSPRVAPRKATLVHRNSVGVLHAPGSHFVPDRNSHTLLGEVLRSERYRRVVGLCGTHSGHDSVPSIRHTLLHVASDAQIRGDCHRYQGVGIAQGTD